MSTREMAMSHLREALQYYAIIIEAEQGWTVKVPRSYSIEVEANGLYRLSDNGQVVAPFDDLDELCRFILH